MQNAQNNGQLMQIHAPLDGVVVLDMIWKQGRMGEAQEGDQMRGGMPFMQVVDPSLMQVQALANDDTSIRLAHNNLLPDLSLSGSYSGNGLAGSPTRSIWRLA